MKYILSIAVTMFFSSLALGSHSFQCDLSAEVTDVKNLNRFDATSARRGEKGDKVKKLETMSKSSQLRLLILSKLQE